MKFYYNDDASEAAGGGDVSVAQSMATTGVRIDAGENFEQEYGNEHQEIEVKSDEGAKPTEDAAKTDGSEEPKKEPVAEVKEQALVTSEPAKPEPTWQEVLKQQPDTVFKELGFEGEKLNFVKSLKDIDPKMASFLNKWQSGGDLKEHLKVMTTDFSSMPSEDVMRHQLRKEYPKASEAQINALYKKEIFEAYKLDTENYSEEEVEEGRLLLDAKAEKYRDDLVKQQEEYLFSPPAKKEAQEVDSSKDAEKKHVEFIQSELKNSSLIKEISASNEFTFGEGEDKFKFPINHSELIDLMVNGDEKGELSFDIKIGSDGQEIYTPKAEHMLYSAMVHKYGKELFTKLAEHYTTIGAKKAIEPINNAKPAETTRNYQQGEQPKSTAGAMATSGKRVDAGE